MIGLYHAGLWSKHPATIPTHWLAAKMAEPTKVCKYCGHRAVGQKCANCGVSLDGWEHVGERAHPPAASALNHFLAKGWEQVKAEEGLTYSQTRAEYFERKAVKEGFGGVINDEGLDDLPPLGTFTPTGARFIYCKPCRTLHFGDCPNAGMIPVAGNPYGSIDPNPAPERTEREIEAGKTVGRAIGRL